MLGNLLFYLLLALVLLGTPAAALLMALRSSGKGWKLAALGTFLLMVPMLLALLIERTVLANQGLSWRGMVTFPCALCFDLGFWLTMLQLGLLMWRRAANRKLFHMVAGRCAIVAVTAFLCTFVSFWVMFLSLFWGNEDRDVTIRGERMVEEQVWMDWYYYTYHGPIVKGSNRCASWELNREDFGEVMS